jgi:hypothetical protein
MGAGPQRLRISHGVESCNTVSLLPFHLGGNLMESDLSFVPKKVPDLTDRQSQQGGDTQGCNGKNENG